MEIKLVFIKEITLKFNSERPLNQIKPIWADVILGLSTYVLKLCLTFQP